MISKLEDTVTTSTPGSRKDWAYRFALERARAGRGLTVRDLLIAVREQFGRGLGNKRATEIIREVSHLARTGEAPATSTVRSGEGVPLPAHLIAETMRMWGVSRIELRADGSLALTPA